MSDSRIVRAALLQATWTGDKQSMIDKHIRYTRQAADQGAQIMCYQELFYGPYFCQVQDTQFYSFTEPIPDGPTTQPILRAGGGVEYGAGRPAIRARWRRRLLQHGGRH